MDLGRISGRISGGVAGGIAGGVAGGVAAAVDLGHHKELLEGLILLCQVGVRQRLGETRFGGNKWGLKLQ